MDRTSSPREDEPVAQCVARSPGGPIHVLLTDRRGRAHPGLQHGLPAFGALEALGGFDPQFSIAGDDVDVCWRIQEQGWKLGFHPGAMVWHHRRSSVRAYLRQQRNYGRAEALLERKWPAKYNLAGHVRWAGRVYGPSGLIGVLRKPSRVYHGVFGSAPFQSLQQPTPTLVGSLPAMPEWYLLIGILAALSALSLAWSPLIVFVPLLVAAVVASIVGSLVASVRQWRAPHHGHRRPLTITLTAYLHLSQPVARLFGRLGFGLAPWRRHHLGRLAFPRPRTFAIWSEQWRSADERLAELTDEWRSRGAIVVAGGACDRWDLEVRCGLFGAARLLMALEDHPGSTQLVRLRIWSHASRFGLASFVLSAGIAVAAALDGAVVVAALLAVVAAVVGLSVFFETAAAHAVMLSALEDDAAASTGSAEFVNGSARDQDVPNHVVPAGGPSRVGD